MRYLGTISVPTGQTKTNVSTATPFTLPKDACQLVFIPSGAGCKVHFGAAAGMDTANSAPLGTTYNAMPWRGRDSGEISIYQSSGSTRTVAVYASDGPGVATFS